jgi:hypothetical protein
LLIEILVNILKTFGSCLVLAMLGLVLVLPHWHTEVAYTGKMRSLAIQSQANILSAPSLIIYSVIKSAVSLVDELNLDPELLEIEVSSPTLEEWI